MTNKMIFLSILASSFATIITRAFPYIVFSKGKIPKDIVYLGKVLPPVIMIILLVYSLRKVNITKAPYELPELLAIIATGLI